MIDVLSVASEAYPLIKTGGLADVVGALPSALAAHDVTMRVLLPGYPAVMGAIEDGRIVAELGDFFGGAGELVAGRAGGLDVIAVHAPHLYARAGNPYVDAEGIDWPDNWQRFAGLSFAGYEIGRGIIDGYRPRILHGHDWQAGLMPAYVAHNAPTGVKTVLTVHNIAFQGRYEWEIFSRLRLDFSAAEQNVIEYYGGIGFLKGGLLTADALTTVSPTYAQEIRTAAYGMGLEGVLQARGDALVGILNGIDTYGWDPRHDAALAQTYRHNSTDLRGANKFALNQRFGLDDAPGPLFAVVSRLTWQKGLDMLVELADQLVASGGKLIVLGSGDIGIENGIRGAAMRHPGKIGIVTGFDEKLSHLMQGGADVMLVPSRFEPCGLTQLYALRYGAVPLVSRVGGLADTVIDANEAAMEAGVATGIVFAPATTEALAEAIRRTIHLYGQPRVWRKMQRRGMKSEVSWDASAIRYADLYAKLLGVKRDDEND